MNIYLVRKKKIERLETNDFCVVVAKSSRKAKNVHPYDGTIFSKKLDENSWWSKSWKWSDPKQLKAKLVGKASKTQKENLIICAAFNCLDVKININ